MSTVFPNNNTNPNICNFSLEIFYQGLVNRG